jgi:hypothetical protein
MRDHLTTTVNCTYATLVVSIGEVVWVEAVSIEAENPMRREVIAWYETAPFILSSFKVCQGPAL